MYPKIHSFNYSLFYVGIPLYEPISCWFFKIDAFSILSIQSVDYLDRSTDSIGIKLISSLRKLGFNEKFQHAELVTTPRWFGYSFNPLSMYFIKKNKSDSEYLAVLLEVNNTFNEKHLYLCYENKIDKKKGYQNSFRVNRAFHVSPFNNRSGCYEAHITGGNGVLDVLLNIFEYTDTVDQLKPLKRNLLLTASVRGESVVLDNSSLLYLFVLFPINTMLTVPRIMFEALKLAYSKRLPVYPRPNPTTGGDGITVVLKEANTFQKSSLEMVHRFLKEQYKDNKNSIQMQLPQGHLNIGTDGPLIKVHSWQFFSRIVLSDNIFYALYLASVRGDFTTTSAGMKSITSLFGLNEMSSVDHFSKEHPKLMLPAHITEHFQSEIAKGRRNEYVEFEGFRMTTVFVDGTSPEQLPIIAQNALLNRTKGNWDGESALPDDLGPVKCQNIRANFFLEHTVNSENCLKINSELK